MKPVALALGATTVLAFAGVVGLALYSEMPVHYLPYLFLDAFLLTQLVVVLVVVLLGLAALLPNPQGQTSNVLVVVALAALALGLLSTLLNVNMTLSAMRATGTTNLKVIGPGLAEGLLPLAFSLLTATVAMARAGRKA